ncbi:hypothetical protein [Pseudoalteromonas sp. H71]|uniref:hypothetical protein n=1 Tax=Pseudoalteromonas sp. H71 TaxID=1348395 RepID=UPI000730BEE2|nr:hypothetical protein [Pseudoalteromonas sp. H71]KTD89753.1 hypothetical protein ATS71_07675 [Pseudoalteromonas sp. H71]
MATPLPINVGRLTQIAGFDLVRMFLTKRGLIALAAFALVWLIILRYPIGLVGGVGRALSIFLILIVTFTPFVALMTLINTFARSSRLSIVLAILYFTAGGIVVGLLQWQIPVLSVLDYLFPGVQIEQLAGQNLPLLSALVIPLVQTAVLLAVAQRIFARSSL